jgi:YD repeat-containing protein
MRARIRRYRWALGLGLGLVGGLLALAPAGTQARSSGSEAALADACHGAVAERVLHRDPVQFSNTFRIKEMSDRQYRLVSHFDQAGARTRYACDALAQGQSWEVTELTLVRW